MRLFEFQAKALLKEWGIPVPSGRTARSVEEILVERPSVLKAQIPAGGRNKAGGVAFVKDQTEAEREGLKILGMDVRGYHVDQLLIEDRIAIQKEYFLAVTYETSEKRAVAIFCPEGGIDIEELAVIHPEKVVKQRFSVRHGFQDFEARNVCLAGGLKGKELVAVSRILHRMVQLFIECDATIVEINPLAQTPEGECFACDAHIDIEDEALYRHKALEEKYGIQERESGAMQQTAFEKKAREINGLDHRGVAGRMIEFEGDIGLLIGGGERASPPLTR